MCTVARCVVACMHALVTAFSPPPHTHHRYLVQRVIPMLPRLLCEELCSLHPGYPRYAFSIVWEVDEDGTIYKEWAGRSVISSRAKLAYPMVQQMIEGCFDPAPWGVELHEGADWEQVGLNKGGVGVRGADPGGGGRGQVGRG